MSITSNEIKKILDWRAKDLYIYRVKNENTICSLG